MNFHLLKGKPDSLPQLFPIALIQEEGMAAAAAIWNYLKAHTFPPGEEFQQEKWQVRDDHSLPSSIRLPPPYRRHQYAWRRNKIQVNWMAATCLPVSEFFPLLKNIQLWLDFLIANKYISSMVEAQIFFYWTVNKKKFPEGGQLDENHVNSGFTVEFPSGKREMVIFRKEEAFKVFLHESFHLFSLDVAFAPHLQHQGDICMRKVFGETCRGNLFEIYTETWARILYTFYCSTSLPEFQTNLSIQTQFARKQAQWVRAYRLTFPTPRKEKTSLFAYYEGTARILHHLSEFWNYCLTTPSPLKMPATSRALEAFCQLLRNTRPLPPSPPPTRDRFTGRTLRMTKKRENFNKKPINQHSIPLMRGSVLPVTFPIKKQPTNIQFPHAR